MTVQAELNQPSVIKEDLGIHTAKQRTCSFLCFAYRSLFIPLPVRGCGGQGESVPCLTESAFYVCVPIKCLI